MSAWNVERVLSVHHWTDTPVQLHGLPATRAFGSSGQFTMVGLEVEGKPLLRAYSMASANYEDNWSSSASRSPNGPLTSRLQHVQAATRCWSGASRSARCCRTICCRAATSILLGTGTGPRAVHEPDQDPDVYERFEQVVLVHGCRFVAELAYQRADRPTSCRAMNFSATLVREQAALLPDRDARAVPQHRPHHRPDRDRQAVRRSRPCRPGSGAGPHHAVRQPRAAEGYGGLSGSNGIREGSSSEPGQFVIEKAFVEK